MGTGCSDGFGIWIQLAWQRGNQVYEILYGFHELANENYLAKYGEESSLKRKRYENMKKRAKEYLKRPTSYGKIENDFYSTLKDIGL